MTKPSPEIKQAATTMTQRQFQTPEFGNKCWDISCYSPHYAQWLDVLYEAERIWLCLYNQGFHDLPQKPREDGQLILSNNAEKFAYQYLRSCNVYKKGYHWTKHYYLFVISSLGEIAHVSWVKKRKQIGERIQTFGDCRVVVFYPSGHWRCYMPKANFYAPHNIPQAIWYRYFQHHRVNRAEDLFVKGDK